MSRTRTARTDEREGMTIEEVARYLGTGLRQTYEAARRDALPAPVVKVGRRMLVSRTALERALGVNVVQFTVPTDQSTIDAA